MIKNEWWLPELRSDLEQGDIVKTNLNHQPIVPITYLKRGKTAKSNTKIWEETQEATEEYGNPRILAKANETLAIIISYGCEIENAKDNQNILLCPVSPLSNFDEKMRQHILKQEAYKYMPIVELTDIEDSYADLSKIFAIPKKTIPQETRIKSMTNEAIIRLQAQIIGFFTRKKLPINR